MTIRYSLTPVDPAAHLFEVHMTVSEIPSEGVLLRLPSWIPGSYMIREFARNIVEISVSDGEITKLDKDTWRVSGASTSTARLLIYAWELTVRTAHLDQTHGFFNGTSVFPRVVGREGERCEVELIPPSDPACEGWKVATTLKRVSGGDWSFGTFEAEDYDELVDHPVEMGTFDLVSFEACGVPHDVVLTGKHYADLKRLAEDLKPICEEQIRFFGEPAPVDRYLFMVMVVGKGYGGLEHRSSTALICTRSDLPRVGETKVSEGYRNFLGLCSHEYFHTWNVKRIKPRAFVPYTFNKEAHTELLWAFEGITSYYDDLMLLRSERIDLKSWLQLLGRTMTRVRRGPGRHRQSVGASSFDAWTKFYRQDENAPNAIVSYYAKGSLVALALDLEMRRISNQTVSLDTLMKALWERYGDGSGVPEEGIETLAEELVGPQIREFFDVAVRGTEDLGLAERLKPYGIHVHTRARRSASDRGGNPAEGGPAVSLGVLTAKGTGGVKLTSVIDGGAARRAGMSAGDVVVAVDGLRATGGDLKGLLMPFTPGQKVNVHAFRGDRLHAFDVVMESPVACTVWLTIDEAEDASVAERRNAWLHGYPSK